MTAIKFRPPVVETDPMSRPVLRSLLLAAVVVLICHQPAVTAEDDNTTPTLRVASLSIFPEKWNKEANARKIEKMVREAAAKKAQLIITPEGVLEGYVVNEVIRADDPAKKSELIKRFRETAEPIDGEYIKRFRRLADELDVYLILGFLEAEGERTFNTAALIGPDGSLVGRYRKTHFHQGYTVNPPGYTPGDEYPVFDIGPLKIGMMICFDRQPPEIARHLALGGADLIACPSYGGTGDWNTRLMQVRAFENDTYVVFTHPEQSLIIDRGGELLETGSQDTITISDIGVTNLKKTRESFTRRRPETYREK